MILRPGTPDDDAAIAALIGEAFPANPKADVEVLRWQYRQNPFGETATWVWEDEGRIVGHYSAFPMPGLLDGERVVGANAVDAAIAPSHQGKFLFGRMAKSLYADCAERGMRWAMVYATNPAAILGTTRAGAEFGEPLRVLAFPNIPAIGGRLTEEVPAAVDDLWALTVERDGIRNGVDRGSAWWAWRYPPQRGYRFAEAKGAVACVRRRGRFTLVLELLATSGPAAQRVLRRATSGLGAVTLVVPGGPLEGLCRRAGMAPVPRRLEPRQANYGVVLTDRSKLGGRPWHVGWGDFDHL